MRLYLKSVTVFFMTISVSNEVSCIDHNVNLNSKEYLNITEPEIPYVPSMTTYCERMYLYWLTSTLYKADGAVVEIGPWLGGSSGYLAKGIKDSGANGWLYCYDRFVWYSLYHDSRFSDYPPAESLKNGHDFKYIVKNHLKNIYDKVKVISAEMKSIFWDSGPIEILHLDAPKNQTNLVSVLKAFGPSLIPGKSIVVMQDFAHPPAYALPVIMQILSEGFKFTGIPDQMSDTVVFKYVQEIDLNILNSVDIYKFSEEKILEIWERMGKNFSNLSHRSYFNIGLAMYLFDIGKKQKALKIAKENIANLSDSYMQKLKAIANIYTPVKPENNSLKYFLNNLD